MLGSQLPDLDTLAESVPIEHLNHPAFSKAGIEVWLRRDDLIDPHISGNKFYKLYFNLLAATERGHKSLVSFGGAWSNHLHALAFAARQYNFSCAAFISGWAPKTPELLSATLNDCHSQSMKTAFLARSDYRKLASLEASSDSLSELVESHFPELQAPLIIPEGGGNLAGARGCMAIARASFSGDSFSHLLTALGTGTSVAGMAAGLDELTTELTNEQAGNCQTQVRIQAVPVIKSDDYSPVLQKILQLRRQLLPEVDPLDRPIELLEGFDDGGYGRFGESTRQAMESMALAEPEIQFDPVYTGKLICAVLSLAEQNFWPTGSKLLLVHSGGLQGRRGFKDLKLPAGC